MYDADPLWLDALVGRLLDAQCALPAAALADDLGCAAGDIAVMTAALRALGVNIREANGGYVCRLMDRLDAATIRSMLSGEARLAVVVKEVCGSTSEVIRTLALPAVCVAEVQSAGRGRRGTSWTQAFGTGLALSLAMPLPQGRLDPLAIALALAVVRCLEALGYADIRLKWPNDLFARDAKLGGLKVEVDGGAMPRLRVGLGINVHATPAGLKRRTMALTELGPPPVRNRLAAALATALMEAVQRFDAEGFAPFAKAFPAYDWLATREVSLQERGDRLQGVARGVDASGALILQTAHGPRLCRAGEVSIGNPLDNTSEAAR
jgi:BirA family biotin operon repressor/biotin-[acetyl-CoA-carboxylase] ligase